MSVSFTPHTFGTEDATSALMNTNVRDPWVDIQDAWDTYTPSWSSTGAAPSLGNGAIAGRYMQVGKTLKFRISWSAGSTTTFGTGFYLFSLPFLLDWNDWDAIGSGMCFDTSATAPYGFAALYDDSGFARLVGSDGTKVGATSPFTFNNGDRIVITGFGELP